MSEVSERWHDWRYDGRGYYLVNDPEITFQDDAEADAYCDEHNRALVGQAAAEEREKISDWLDEMDRGLKKKQVDAGGDVMTVMGTISLVGQLSTLIRMNEYEQWSAWGKQEHLK
jgi:hypothetical protein